MASNDIYSFSVLALIITTTVRLASCHTNDDSLVDLMTSEELQDTFGVSHKKQVPKHFTLIPKPKFRQDGSLHFVDLPVEGRERRIGTFHSVGNQLFAPNLVTVYRHDNRSQLEIGNENWKNCHYHSVINNSLAAISTCDGNLKGVILQETGIYVLHPVPERHQRRLKRSTDTADSLGLHILYKRDATAIKGDSGLNDEVPNFCGVESTFAQEDFISEADDMGVDSDNMAVIGRQLTRGSDLIVEMAIFIDEKLWNKFYKLHGAWANSKLKDYTSTVMNSMQIMYKQRSMTPKLNFKVIRYEVLKSQPNALHGGYHRHGHAQDYLNVFCKYQRKLTYRNWDHAFMLTGYDIHRGTYSRTISGIARLHGMCDPWNSCAITEGLDFTSVFIGTHEMGHSVGMNHDEPYCSSSYIMSASLGPGKVTWSTCSMKDYHRFIKSLNKSNRWRRRKNCLIESNHKTFLEINLGTMPGQKYTADQQCALMHGKNYRHVTPRRGHYDGICNMMWCGQSSFGRIITSHPALEGTICANGKWCQHGKCVVWSSGSLSTTIPPGLTVVNGGWSGWSAVTCSYCKCPDISEGIGLLVSKRHCNNPTKRNGGRDCSGASVMGVVCQRYCSGATKTITSYMRDTCTAHKSKLNDFELTGDGHQLSKYPDRACKIFCVVRNTFVSAKNYRFYGDYLPDGTKCGSGYCVDGKCMPLQCSDRNVGQRESHCPSVKCNTNTIGRSSSSSTSTWGKWSGWSVCSVTCGSGKKRRTRRCSGSSCSGSSEETASCNAQTSCYYGQWNTWAAWGSCSVTCGSGYENRVRTCSATYCSGDKKQRRLCSGGYCPWSSWSGCSRDCGGGTKRRTRRCPGGGCSGKSYEDHRCNEHSCGGTWSYWGNWGYCSATCGGNGYRQRTRTCSGSGCKKYYDTKQERCGFDYCPWKSWTACSVTCGSGTKARYRTCPGGGCTDKSNSKIKTSETISCNPGLCTSTSISWTNWGSWTRCSVTCGQGVKGRYRRCVDPKKVTKTGCAGSSSDRADCQGESCGQWNTWSAWSYCSRTCGELGKKSRTRACIGASDCPGVNKQTVSCGSNSRCPGSSLDEAKGLWSSWSQWNKCSVTCGTGIKSRQKKCSKGTCKGSHLETISCNTVPCGESHAWGQWNSWSQCSRTCGGGRRTRIRTCFSGGNCPGWPREFESCGTDSCTSNNLPLYGSWASWSAWSDCSQTCGGGVRRKSRNCEKGQQCVGRGYEEKNCKRKPCAEWGGWGHWSACSKSCGYGSRKRVRNCYGWGSCSGNTSVSVSCNKGTCNR